MKNLYTIDLVRRFLISNLIFVFLIGSPVAAFAATKSGVKTPKPAAAQQAPGQTVKKEVQQRNIERKAEIKQEVKNKIETKKEEVKNQVVKPQVKNKPTASKPTVKTKPAPRTFKVAPKKK